MTEAERTELIEGYLAGKLTDSKVLAVEKLLIDDSDFQREFREQKLLWEALGPSKVNDFRKIVGEVLEEESSREKKNKSFRLPSLAIAASFTIILLVLAWGVLKPDSNPGEELFSDYFSPPMNSTLFRSSNSEQPASGLIQNQQLFDSLYYTKDYLKALTQLNALGNQFPNAQTSEYFFMQGILYLLNDQAEAAVKQLEKIEVGHPYDKSWYIGLSYLRMGELNAAKALFSTLSESENPYRKEATTILGIISE